MADDSGDSKPWWAIDKAAWRERFHLFYELTSITKDRNQPLKPWSNSDIDEFVHSDPVYGPQLKLIRQGAKIAAGGALAGGVVTSGVVWRYSKSPHGVLLSFVAGAVVGWSLGQEGATIAYGLHKFDCMDTNLKFLEWWQEKTEGSG